MQTVLIIAVTILTLFGVKAEGVMGIQTDEAKNGVVYYSTERDVNAPYNYISYSNIDAKKGDVIGTLYTYGSDEPDDILTRYDFWETKGENE